MTWLNGSLNLHSGLRTIPHLVLTHNTQDFDSINAYLICVIVHVQMRCVCSITCRSNPKRFLSVLNVFESDFILSCFQFLFKIHFCVFLQKLVQRQFREKFVTWSFPWNQLKGNKKFSISYKESRYCFTTKSFSRKLLCFHGAFRD